MPLFVCTENSENTFQVERWQRGEYVSMEKEIYPSRELCEKRVQDLIQEFDNEDDFPPWELKNH